MIVNVQITGNTATSALQQKLQSLSPEKLAAQIGPVCQALTEKHLTELGPNKHHWPSTGFYKKFVRNVGWQATAGGIALTIAPAEIQGRSVSLAQRIYGGSISPVKARALAYPISPISYGKVPADFPKLFVLRTNKGTYLAQSLRPGNPRLSRVDARQPASTRPARDGLRLLFKLASGVFQSPTRGVLPTNAEYTAAIAQAVAKN